MIIITTTNIIIIIMNNDLILNGTTSHTHNIPQTGIYIYRALKKNLRIDFFCGHRA